MTSIGKSDHVLIELELREGTYIARNEKDKRGRRIYSKTDFHGIKKFFKETKLNEFYREEVGVEEKWRMFRNIYNKGVET